MDSHDGSTNSAGSHSAAPTLPRLKSRPSLGRLHAFGGILHYPAHHHQQHEDVDDDNDKEEEEMIEAGRKMSSVYTKDKEYNTYSPILSQLRAQRSVQSLPSPTAPPPEGGPNHNNPGNNSNNKQEAGSSSATAATRSIQQDNHDSFHTPVKSIAASYAVLRALKDLDREHSRSSSPSAPLSSPLSFLPSTAITPRILPPNQVNRNKENTKNNNNRNNQHAHQQHTNLNDTYYQSCDISCSSVTTVAHLHRHRRETSLDGLTSDSSCDDDNNSDTNDAELVAEIQQDMENGGYSSLEQILAKNGFQVCRVATPPSTGREQRRHTIAMSSDAVILPSSTSGSPAIADYPDITSRVDPSLSAATPRMTVATGSVTKATQKPVAHSNTIKSKPSLLSFSNFVSSIWGSSSHATSSTRSKITTGTAQPCNNSNAVASNGYSAKTDLPPPETSTPVNELANPNMSLVIASPDSPLEGAQANSADNAHIEEQDRDEHIKGWLKQTVEATNLYMSEAKRQIEAARIAMGASAPVDEAASRTFSSSKDAASRKSGSVDNILCNHSEDDDEFLEDTIKRLAAERREGTQSTIESKIIETPTCSPTTLAHAVVASTISKHTSNSGSRYSPPLKQVGPAAMAPQLVQAISYHDDSPLKRNHNNAKQGPIGSKKRESVHYPPIPSNVDRDDQDEPLTAESLLRGTLRNDESLSKAGGLERDMPLPLHLHFAQKQKVMPLQGQRHPSVQTVFGLPKTTARPPVKDITSEQAQSAESARVYKDTDSNHATKFRHSTTDSLSTDTLSDSRGRSSATTGTSSAAPKILRKTASKHTLRKAASPILSTTEATVMRKDSDNQSPKSIESSSPTVSFKVGGASRVRQSVSNNSSTPVKGKASPRGPVPRSKGIENAQAGGHGSTSASSTPRQIAHRNPHDSPIGDTPVIKSPPFNRYRQVHSQQPRQEQPQDSPIRAISTRDMHKIASIMDDENDATGLWSPPRAKRTSKVGTSSRNMPLGHTSLNKQMGDRAAAYSQRQLDEGKTTDIPKVSGSDPISAPKKLKAKESLERILAVRQMHEDGTATSGKKNVPPVPTLPRELQTAAALRTMKSNDNARDALGTASVAKVEQQKAPSAVSSHFSSPTPAPVLTQSPASKTQRSTGFAGTLRGLLDSAVAGWNEGSASFADSKAAGAAVNPSPVLRPKSSAHQFPGKRERMVRRAKSMYIDGSGGMPKNKEVKDEWTSFRDRNSLILPTIVISQHLEEDD